MRVVPIIVWEKASRWAGLLRGGLPIASAKGTGLTREVHWQVREVRSLTQVEAILEEQSQALVLLEVTQSNLPSIYEALTKLPRFFAGTKYVALTDSRMSWAVPFLREAGASEVFLSSLDLTRWPSLATRFAQTVPEKVLDWQEEIQEMLPWPAYRT